jgi:hypothetical protein
LIVDEPFGVLVLQESEEFADSPAPPRRFGPSRPVDRAEKIGQQGIDEP